MNSSQPNQNQQDACPPPQPIDHGSTMGIPVSSTTIQYYSVHIESQPLGSWSTGLFDCFDDVKNCCMTLWCPCVTFGRISEIVDRGSTSCGANGTLYTLIALVTGSLGLPLQWLYSCSYRSKLRGQYRLVEEPCLDCLVHCCCESCAMCQEYRELQNRGFDMTIGWHANVERQSRGVITMPPIITRDMIRGV